MTEILSIGELARLKRQIQEKDAEIERLTGALAEAQTELNRADGLNAMLRMQFNDFLETIKGWKESMALLETNVMDMKHRL